VTISSHKLTSLYHSVHECVRDMLLLVVSDRTLPVIKRSRFSAALMAIMEAVSEIPRTMGSCGTYAVPRPRYLSVKCEREGGKSPTFEAYVISIIETHLHVNVLGRQPAM
jgi:hypothetical protein